MNKVIVLLVMALTLSHVKGQEPSGWFALFGNDKLKKGFDLHYEVQYRNHNPIGRLNQLFFRTGLGYSFLKNSQNILLGYGFIHNKPIDYFNDNYTSDEQQNFVFNEHRIFQQYIIKHSISRLLLTHRYRFEQRFFRSNEALRARYFLSASLPLNKPLITEGTVYLNGYNELFMTFKDTYYDRNRTYFAFGYGVSNNLKVELGYLREDISGEIFNHFQISLFNTIDFKLKDK